MSNEVWPGVFLPEFTRRSPDPLPRDFARVEREAIAAALVGYIEKMREGYRLTAIERYAIEAECAERIRFSVLDGLAAPSRAATKSSSSVA